MASIELHLRQLPGADALDKLVASASELFPNDPFTLTITTNILAGHYQEQSMLLADTAKAARLAEIKKELADCSYVTCRSLTLSGFPNQCSLAYSSDDGVVAKLHVEVSESVKKEQAPRIAKVLSKRFKLTTPSAIIDESLPKGLQEQLRYREQTLADLQAAVTRLSIVGAQEAEKQAKFLQQKIAELDERYQGKETQLEADHRKRAEELRQKVAAFETRESKYVRRDLLGKMREEIEKQKVIALSPKTAHKRWVIHGTFLLAISLGLGLAAVFAYKVFMSATPDWHYFTPMSGGVVMFISTLIYYIKWNDQWFKEHAEAEFRNMRFAADILRASWLAELLFEWEKEKKSTQLPESIIASLARNLFRDERWGDTEHPAEALTKALGGVSSLRVSKDGVEIKRKAEKPS